MIEDFFIILSIMFVYIATSFKSWFRVDVKKYEEVEINDDVFDDARFTGGEM